MLRSCLHIILKGDYLRIRLIIFQTYQLLWSETHICGVKPIYVELYTYMWSYTHILKYVYILKYMETLPIERLFSILITLPYEELLEKCSISRLYADICRDEHFWQLKFNHDFPNRPLQPNISFRRQYDQA